MIPDTARTNRLVHKAGYARWMCGLILSGLGMPGPLFAAPEISVTGDWAAPTITYLNLSGGAGTDIAPIESSGGQATLSVTDGSGGWTISVARTSGSLPSDARVFVRRTSSNPGISGGTVYQEITGASTTLLTGTGNFNDSITLQFKIEASVQVPPSAYSLVITYSIV